MECFAFGDATVRLASLETSFHAANHTIPPPSSYEGLPLYIKDKNHSPFHGEKPLMITWFLEKRLYQSPKTILHGRDAILRVHAKWLILSMVLQLWADVKYHVPTGFGFSPKTSGFCPFVDATDLDRCEALASAKGCFLCFCFWFHPVIFYWTGKIGEKRWVSVQ